MTTYAIALGSNLGERIDLLRAAAIEVGRLGDVRAIGRLYETEPVGGPEQGPYLNSVMVVDTALAPEDLLAELHRIEAAAGRERGRRWAARTLDLDIVAMEPGTIATEGLTVPHQRAAEREFVLRPLVDVWPDALVGEGLRAREALGDLEPQGVDELARRWARPRRPRLGPLLVLVQFIWIAAIAVALGFDGSVPDGTPEIVRVLGAALAVLGAGLAFISSRRLGPSLTAFPEPKAEGSLTETGPYAYARHPIYGGVSLFILGTSMILDSILGSILSVGLLAFFYFKSVYEERQLRIKYPGYSGYRKRVPRRLIPFVI